MKTCRSCQAILGEPVLDLGAMPLANSNLKADRLSASEPAYPLRIFFCGSCGLVQQLDFTKAEEIFDEYQYFSSYSKSWVEHARLYVDMITDRLGLDERSSVIEIASNDGYLLQFFKQKGIPALGIEPSKTVAEAAVAKGLPTLVKFFTSELARELAGRGHTADLILGNNVLAHVPNLHDFVEGLSLALKPGGVVTMEFPHLLRLLEQAQFDTIYHEHFSYFSLTAVERLFARHGLVLFDVEEIPTHGGSLRIYGRLASHPDLTITKNVLTIKLQEEKAGLDRRETYVRFAGKVDRVKKGLVKFLEKARSQKKRVVGYGAPAKGNTLLNYCGVGTDLLEYTVDASPHKQGLHLPGSHLPIHAPGRIRETKPDFVLILPWNIRDEIMGQMSYIDDWGGKFVVAIPEVKVLRPSDV
jgi:SAM-dependent methyltransferase